MDESLSSKWNPIKAAIDAVDGTGLTGGALTEAYTAMENEAKQVEFIQNTVIETVDQATALLTNFMGSTSAPPATPVLQVPEWKAVSLSSILAD